MILIDGIKYELWAPEDEGEFTPRIDKHAKDIFGEESLYFGDLKRRIKSPAGAGSIPDGWVVVLGMPLKSYVVEIEHSSHDVYGHISPQIDKILAGLKNPATQHQIVDAIYEEIKKDAISMARVKRIIGSEDLHKLLSDSIVKQQPELILVIDRASDQLRECVATKFPTPKIIEFATYETKGVGLAVHAHLFEPIALSTPSKSEVSKKEKKSKKKPSTFWTVQIQNLIEVGLVKEGQGIFADYKGKRFEAIVLSSGKIKFLSDDSVHNRLSNAASHITNTPMNGWRFWKTLDAEEHEILMHELREKYVARG